MKICFVVFWKLKTIEEILKSIRKLKKSSQKIFIHFGDVQTMIKKKLKNEIKTRMLIVFG